MQKISLRLNRFYSASTQVVDSNLSLIDNYYVYSQRSLGGGVVTEFNVREFLENDKNESITRDFFSFITANTSNSEFVEIFYSDKKLSSSFNDFYSTSVLSGVVSQQVIIDDELIQTSAITYNKNNFLWENNAVAPQKFLNEIPLDVVGNNRDNTPVNSLTTYTNDQSYYVPIFIRKTMGLPPRDKFDICKSANKIIGFIASTTVNETETFDPLDSNLRTDGSEATNTSFSGSMSNLFTPSGDNPIIQPSGFIVTGVVHSTIQCFVDINLHLDSNEYWNNVKPEISNQPPVYTGLTATDDSNLRYGFTSGGDVFSPPVKPNPNNISGFSNSIS